MVKEENRKEKFPVDQDGNFILKPNSEESRLWRSIYVLSMKEKNTGIYSAELADSAVLLFRERLGAFIPPAIMKAARSSDLPKPNKKA